MERQQKKEIDLKTIKGLMNSKYCLICVDHNDSLDGSHDVFRKCIEEKCADPLHEHFDLMYSEREGQAVRDAIEELKKRLVGTGYTGGDFDSLMFGKRGIRYTFALGEMAEWSIAAVLKTVVPARVPRVRIPVSPQ